MTLVHRMKHGFQTTLVYQLCRELPSSYQGLLHEASSEIQPCPLCDLLAPEGYGEIIGGSMREEDYDALVAKMNDLGMDTTEYEFYLDLRKYGTVPHGGFGIGIERMVTFVAGTKHIREAIPFPRMLHRIKP